MTSVRKVRPSVQFKITGRVTRRMKVGLAIMRVGAWLVHTGGVNVSIERDHNGGMTVSPERDRHL